MISCEKPYTRIRHVRLLSGQWTSLLIIVVNTKIVIDFHIFILSISTFITITLFGILYRLKFKTIQIFFYLTVLNDGIILIISKYKFIYNS